MNRVLPILFNTDMVKAILDDRKTATRRKINIDITNQFDVEQDEKTVVAYINQATGDSYKPEEICRYQPDDILYVRETWNYGYIETSDNPGNYEAWFEQLQPNGEYDHYIKALSRYYYKADGDVSETNVRMVWRPSIHMPKEAARIWLKVTDVRVERLCKMSLDDFLSEGVLIRPEAFNDPENAYRQAKRGFISIWNPTIKKTEMNLYSWTANPWVWTIEFERCGKPKEEH